MIDTPPVLAPEPRTAPRRSARPPGAAPRSAPAPPRVRPWMPRLGLAAWTLAMCAAFLLPSHALPETGSWGFDKIEHIAVFAFWTMLARAAGLSARAVVGLGIAFAIASEIAQHLLPMLNRAGDLRDVAADAAGIAAGLAIVAFVARRRRAAR